MADPAVPLRGAVPRWRRPWSEREPLVLRCIPARIMPEGCPPYRPHRSRSMALRYRGDAPTACRRATGHGPAKPAKSALTEPDHRYYGAKWRKVVSSGGRVVKMPGSTGSQVGLRMTGSDITKPPIDTAHGRERATRPGVHRRVPSSGRRQGAHRRPGPIPCGVRSRGPGQQVARWLPGAPSARCLGARRRSRRPAAVHRR